MKSTIHNTQYSIRYTLCAILIALLCIILPQTSQAATYYLDAVNGDDANPGTAEASWKTLNRAYTWYSGSGSKVTEGDTVLFKNGNYGMFQESTNVNPGQNYLFYRNNWVTYKADVGHNPTLDSISIQNLDKWGGIGNGRSYLVFDGFRILNGAGFKYTSYVQVRNCNVTGTPPPYAELNTGFFAPYVYGSGISAQYSNYITVEDNEVSQGFYGIYVANSSANIVIKKNIVHYIGCDGIVAAGTSNTVMENNTVYDLSSHRAVIDIYGTKTGDFTAGEEVTLEGTTARGIFHRWTGSYVQVYQITQVDFKGEWQAGRGTTIMGQTSGATLTISNVDPQHTDGMTLMGNTNVIFRGNTIIRRRLGGSNGQGLKVDRGTNITIENNLIDAGSHLIMIDYADMPLEIVNMNNNIFYGVPGSGIDGRVRIYLGSGANRDVTINNMYNNIINRLMLSGDVGSNYTRIANHGNNIFGPYDPNGSGGPTYPFTLNSTEQLLGNQSTFDSLFVDAANGDFHLAEGSLAIDFGDPAHAPATDILGNPRDANPDAGCYEYGASTLLYGDVNADGEISAYDAALAAHIAVDLEHPDIKNRAAAEVSGDGEVTAYDAALIAQRAVGLIEKFPAEK